MIPKEQIEEIRSRCNVVEVVGAYLPQLRRRGSTFKCNCPFHQEKTPSFTVNEPFNERNTIELTRARSQMHPRRAVAARATPLTRLACDADLRPRGGVGVVCGATKLTECTLPLV